MPKIIKDIENKILKAAEELFVTQGFRQTDMRTIAGHAEIAVGTIYKYHKDKQDLYMQVMARGWSRMITRLETIAGDSGDPEQQLVKMLDVLVNELSERRSLSSIWREISTLYAERNPDFHQDNQFIGLHGRFAAAFGMVLGNMLDSEKRVDAAGVIDRLGSYAFVMVVESSLSSSGKAAGASRLIADLLTTYIHRINTGSISALL